MKATDISGADLSRFCILITNDDGISASGLSELEAIARTITGDVWVCAPDIERSACGHSVTIHDPLRLSQHGDRRFSTSGTPADCVFIGVHHLLKGRKPDLVLSGINRGLNLGTHVSYSGTVAAAREATVLGVPAIAFSQELRDWSAGARWDVARRFLPDIVRRLVLHGFSPGILYNVNFPDVDPEEATGPHVAPLGVYDLEQDLQVRRDPRGRDYFWVGANFKTRNATPGTDIAILAEGGITVTPLSLDSTDQSALRSARTVFAEAGS